MRSRFWTALIAGAAITLTACGGGSSATTASPAASAAGGATATAARELQESKIVFLETRAAGDPLDTFSLNSLAIEHIQRSRETGDVAELTVADVALTRSLAIRRSDNYDALALLASISNTRHDFAKALDLAQEAVPIKPRGAYGYGVLGDAYMGLGLYDDADRAYEQMANLSPDMAALGRKALLLTVRGRTDEALSMWGDAIKRAQGDGVPEHAAWARSQLASLRFSLGDVAGAGEEYQRSLEAFPGYVHALAGLGRVAAARQDWPRAIDAYTRAIERVPLPEYVIALGDVYAASGDATRAQQQFDLVAAIEQLYVANGVNVDLVIALYNADHNRDLAATAERARRAYGVQPSLQAADVLAWAELKAGNVDAAQAAIDTALATGTRDPLVLFHAGMIYRAAGDASQAKAYLQRLEDQAPRFSVLYASAAKDALAGL